MDKDNLVRCGVAYSAQMPVKAEPACAYRIQYYQIVKKKIILALVSTEYAVCDLMNCTGL